MAKCDKCGSEAKIINNSITIRNSNVSGAVGNNAYSNKRQKDE